MGAKVFASSRIRGVGYVITLFDQQRGDLLAILDARDMTAMRTAATSALAADHLLPSTPATVAMLGSGMEARSHLAAMAAIRPIAEVRVYSPTAENRERFAEDARREYGVSCRATAVAAEAVDGASLVVGAARSRDETPVLAGGWLDPAATVISIGSTLPEQREVDAHTIERADLIVADLVAEVTQETGDFIAARASGIHFDHKVCRLSDLVSGRRARTEHTVAVYKSVGSGLQDIATAELAYVEASRQGLAVPLPMALSIKRTPRVG